MDFRGVMAIVFEIPLFFDSPCILSYVIVGDSVRWVGWFWFWTRAGINIFKKKNVNIVLASSLVHYIVLIRMIALLWTRIVSALSSIYW